MSNSKKGRGGIFTTHDTIAFNQTIKVNMAYLRVKGVIDQEFMVYHLYNIIIIDLKESKMPILFYNLLFLIFLVVFRKKPKQLDCSMKKN